MSKINKKKILKIRFTLISPMIIGSGKSENTDNDILLNSKGLPYIPGTAIAGVIRSLIEESGNVSQKDMRDYFGFVPNQFRGEGSTEDNAISSKILFYDANVEQGAIRKSKRDFVKLDDWKTAVKGAKFDMEALEAGVTFVTYIEQNTDDEFNKDFIDIITELWKSGRVRFGAKTMRGFGRIETLNIYVTEFDLSNKQDLVKWLDHSMYDDDLWVEDAEIYSNENCGCTEKSHKGEAVLTLGLNIKSALSIRRYTTNVGEADYAQLRSNSRDGRGAQVPVIPGSTWAGAFRHHMESINKECIGDYFGNVAPDKNNKDRKVRSNIMFSESYVNESNTKIIARNAIDRFSGGTIDGALYTESTEYGGNTVLEIRLLREKPKDELVKALSASIADLHAGILSVGGLTAVGRGLFSVTNVNGVAFDGSEEDADKLYDLVFDSLQTEINNAWGGDK